MPLLLRLERPYYAHPAFFTLSLRSSRLPYDEFLIGEIGEKFWKCSKFLADLKKCPLLPRSHNAVFTMPPIANDPCTLSPIYPDLLDRGPDRHSGMGAREWATQLSRVHVMHERIPSPGKVSDWLILQLRRTSRTTLIEGTHGFKLVTMPTAEICTRHAQSNVGVAIAKAP